MLRSTKLGFAHLGLMTKVAKLYYEQNLKQPEIAARLGISQSRVSRLITEAQEAGIVKINIVAPENVYPDIEDELREKLGLRDVVIAHNEEPDEASIQTVIGIAGANYLETTLAPKDSVGISSWSATLLSVADAMSGRFARAKEVVQLQGGVGNARAQALATRLTDRFARLTGAEPRFLPAPGLVGSREVRDALLNDNYLQETVAAWQKLNVLLLGIGSVEPSPLLSESGNTVSTEDLELLRSAGAIGDVCSHFFDAEGRDVGQFIEERLIGLSRETLKSVARRVGFAGGLRKVEPIISAAKGGWINVLVTDSTTAKAMLRQLG